MFRWITILLSFALVVGSTDAATHFDALLGSHGPHELHSQLHDPGEPDVGGDTSDAAEYDGDETAHFCHCAAHSPAMIAAFEVPLQSMTQRGVAIVPRACSDGVHAPPLRPPNLA